MPIVRGDTCLWGGGNNNCVIFIDLLSECRTLKRWASKLGTTVFTQGTDFCLRGCFLLFMVNDRILNDPATHLEHRFDSLRTSVSVERSVTGQQRVRSSTATLFPAAVCVLQTARKSSPPTLLQSLLSVFWLQWARPLKFEYLRA